MQTQIAPTGGCPGKLYAGRTAALCLRCARQSIGGEQIAPAWYRLQGESDCPNFVAHGCHVALLDAAQRPPMGGPVPPTVGGPACTSSHLGGSPARSMRNPGDDT